MIVVDASAVVDHLRGGGAEDPVTSIITEADELYAPAHLPVESASALWRLVRTGHEVATTAESAIGRLAIMPITLLPTDVLLTHAWNLRKAFRVADAFYVACARSLSMPLLTTDARLARAATALGVPTLGVDL